VTDRDRPAAIREELARADTALAAADHLARGGFSADAVSRLYYSLLFRVRALLLTKDLEPRSHEGALRLLSLHFVKSGRLDREAAHLFSRLMKYREEADYTASIEYTAEDVAGFRAEVEIVSARITDLIRVAGYGR
jgi:hypothetical protein